MLYSSVFLSIAVNIDGALAEQVGAVLGVIEKEKEYARDAMLPCWRCRRSLRAIGHPWDVDCYRDGEKDNELASGALRKPGRGDGGYGKKDQDDCEQWRKEAGRLAVPVPRSLMESGQKLRRDPAAKSHSSLRIPVSLRMICCSLTLIFSP